MQDHKSKMFFIKSFKFHIATLFRTSVSIPKLIKFTCMLKVHMIILFYLLSMVLNDGRLKLLFEKRKNLRAVKLLLTPGSSLL